jgi:hypothetical protein
VALIAPDNGSTIATAEMLGSDLYRKGCSLCGTPTTHTGEQHQYAWATDREIWPVSPAQIRCASCAVQTLVGGERFELPTRGRTVGPHQSAALSAYERGADVRGDRPPSGHSPLVVPAPPSSEIC